ncbi:tyrosine-protein phosphatase [Ornithinibacillus contaminans]|uniref:tyrosine-protein phosphatase n=1 Tax=Ornithinibacillus contaminans TaxID=694055 RepID=UPI00069FE174|nr:tyrosine-protein phosphatase [Ornithinibacillus contaminans]
MKQVLQATQLAGTFNFRELGGYETASGRRVKKGMLFRAGNLSRLTEADIEVLKGLAIKNICDLRDLDEVSRHPDPEMEGIKWHHISLIQDEGVVRQPGDLNHFEQQLLNSKPGEMLLSLNRKLVSNTTGFRKIFQVLLDSPGKPMLFHCMAGKDRTGSFAALLLSLLEVPREIIEEDYLMTNNVLAEVEAGFKAIGYTLPDVIDKEIVAALYEARIEYIRELFHEIERQYDTFDSYIRDGIGLSEEEIELLKDHYLE